MSLFKEYWLSDYYRNTDGKKYHFVRYFFMGKKMRLLYWLRKCQFSHKFHNYFCRFIYYMFYYGWNNNHISWRTRIGKGLYLGHNGGRYLNAEAIIGKNCNINQNVTIGQENRGSREGSPTIGDAVWIGANTVIVGKVHIGNNVLIAPNSFVNFDIEENSIYVNGKVIKNNNSTDKYICDVV